MEYVIQSIFADLLDLVKRKRVGYSETYKSLNYEEFITCCLNRVQESNITETDIKNIATCIKKKYIRLPEDFDFILIIFNNIRGLAMFFTKFGE